MNSIWLYFNQNWLNMIDLNFLDLFALSFYDKFNENNFRSSHFKISGRKHKIYQNVSVAKEIIKSNSTFSQVVNI